MSSINTYNTYNIYKTEIDKPTFSLPHVSLCQDNRNLYIQRNLFEMVDLGLPSETMWSNINLGAARPTDFGYYFAFGETSPRGVDWKTSAPYDWKHAPFNNGQNDYDNVFFNKYKSEWFNGNSLKPQYDVATKTLGKGWGIPTTDDFQELINNTDSEWIDNYDGSGINGYKYTNRTDSSKFIFLPAAGNKIVSNVVNIGIYCDVWCNNLFDSGIGSSAWVYPSVEIFDRSLGFPIRPIYRPTNYKMVDLGLPSGLKWANMNIGAEKETGYGDYYMFGSTTPDTDNVCDWEHCPFNNGSSDYDSSYFTTHRDEWFNGDVLKPQYDAATVNMGSGWRMPTKAEFNELLYNTNNELTTIDGINGYKFVNNTDSSKYIFIPASGIRDGSSFDFVGGHGYVRSSSLDSSNLMYACHLDFSSIYFDVRGSARFYGYAVRGVHA